MKKHFMPLAAVAMAIGSTASADPFVDAVVRNFQEMGYQFVEVERGPSQLRFEGVRGTEELEVVYDLASGRIIKQETDRADAEYIGRTGVEFDTSNEDFVGNDDNDDDNDDDDRSGSRDDNDDDNDDDDSSGSRDDDDDDDNSGSGSGSDDDNDDDDSGSESDDSDDDDSSSDDSSDDSDDDNDDDN